MDDKKVNDPKQNPNSSETFKSTDIYASKASNQADYFAHVQPTFQDKLRAKAKADKAARAAKAQERAAKAQDPAFQKRRRKIIIGILATFIAIVLGLIAWLIYMNFIHPAIEEQQAREERTAVQEGSEDEPITIASIKQYAEELAQADSDTALDEAISYINNYIEQIDDQEAIKTLELTIGEIQSEHGDKNNAVSYLTSLDNDGLYSFQKYYLYRDISNIYRELGDVEQANTYSEKANNARAAAEQKGEFEKYGL